MSSLAIQAELIRSVIDFTGATEEKARKLLEESEWKVPEAVTRFFLEVEAVPSRSQPRQQTMAPSRPRPPPVPANRSSQEIRSPIASLIEALKSCFGWAASSCWNALRWFIFGPMMQRGSGNLFSYFNSLPEGVPRPLCVEESFQTAAARARTRENRKVMMVYLNCGSSDNFDFVTRNVVCDESVVSVINEQFIFWGGDVDFSGPLHVLNALPIRNIPMFIALISFNTTELKVVAACAAPHFTVETAMNVLQKAQEAQDRLMAEDEQFRINRSLREDQDREYQEALDRDRRLEEERQKKLEDERKIAELEAEKQQAKMDKLTASLREKEAAMNRVERAKTILSATTIVVRLPSGVRIEKKFDKSEVIATLYDWVLACGLIHSHALEVSKSIHPGNFALSTSFPARRLTDMEATLEQLDLVPNAVLAFAKVGDDSDDE